MILSPRRCRFAASTLRVASAVAFIQRYFAAYFLMVFPTSNRLVYVRSGPMAFCGISLTAVCINDPTAHFQSEKIVCPRL
jgi:hypothetical protein